MSATNDTVQITAQVERNDTNPEQTKLVINLLGGVFSANDIPVIRDEIASNADMKATLKTVLGLPQTKQFDTTNIELRESAQLYTQQPGNVPTLDVLFDGLTLTDQQRAKLQSGLKRAFSNYLIPPAQRPNIELLERSGDTLQHIFQNSVDMLSKLEQFIVDKGYTHLRYALDWVMVRKLLNDIATGAAGKDLLNQLARALLNTPYDVPDEQMAGIKRIISAAMPFIDTFIASNQFFTPEDMLSVINTAQTEIINQDTGRVQNKFAGIEVKDSGSQPPPPNTPAGSGGNIVDAMKKVEKLVASQINTVESQMQVWQEMGNDPNKARRMGELARERDRLRKTKTRLDDAFRSFQIKAGAPLERMKAVYLEQERLVNDADINQIVPIEIPEALVGTVGNVAAGVTGAIVVPPALQALAVATGYTTMISGVGLVLIPPLFLGLGVLSGLGVAAWLKEKLHLIKTANEAAKKEQEKIDAIKKQYDLSKANYAILEPTPYLDRLKALEAEAVAPLGAANQAKLDQIINPDLDNLGTDPDQTIDDWSNTVVSTMDQIIAKLGDAAYTRKIADLSKDITNLMSSVEFMTSLSNLESTDFSAAKAEADINANVARINKPERPRPLRFLSRLFNRGYKQQFSDYPNPVPVKNQLPVQSNARSGGGGGFNFGQ